MRVRDFIVSSRIHLFRPDETVKDAASVFMILKLMLRRHLRPGYNSRGSAGLNKFTRLTYELYNI